MEFVFDTHDNDDLFSSNDATKFSYKNSSLSSSSPRKSVVTGLADIEFTGPTKRMTKTAPVKYLGPSKSKVKRRSFKLSWGLAPYFLLFALVLRLVFMEGGIIDFMNMDQFLKNKERDLVSIQKENLDLKKEIHLIKTSTSYQKKLARKHLGVMAQNEYLVLFAKPE